MHARACHGDGRVSALLDAVTQENVLTTEQAHVIVIVLHEETVYDTSSGTAYVELILLEMNLCTFSWKKLRKRFAMDPAP